MEQFISSFSFDIIGIIALSVLLILLIIQIYFYFGYYKKPLRYYNANNGNKPSSNTPSVSVVIIGKDESLNLEKCLPSILSQDYPNFEVIVVNEGSTDETEFLLKKLKKEYPNLYSTFSPIPENDDEVRNKVLPLTIGIKAAQKEILLFTEADTIPASNQWIRTMVEPFGEGKDISLGHCEFKGKGEFWRKIAIFDNLLFSLQYLSKAIKKSPFGGTYRNVAYRKNLFFSNKGFSSALNYESAELVFLNQIMTSENTGIVLNKESFVSTNLQEYSQWKDIKTSYYRAKSHFSKFTPSVFSLETISRYFFYITTIGAIAYSAVFSLWAYLMGTILVFSLRYIMQIMCFTQFSKVFNTPKYGLIIPPLEILQPYYNSRFVSRSKAKKRRRK